MISSYTTLVEAIKDKAEDEGTEFALYIPVAIDLAEERLFRDLDLPELEKEKTGTLTTGSTTLEKPSEYEFGVYLSILNTTTNKRSILKKKTKSFILDYWPDFTVEGTPKYYGDNTVTSFILVPTPDSDYPYILRYIEKPAKLSVSNPTNYFIENCKDILFAACMSEMAEFMKAFNQKQIWDSDYVVLRDTWNLEQIRYRRDGETSIRNVDSSPNSLRHTLNSGA